MFEDQIRNILERCQYPPFSDSDIESLIYYNCKHVYEGRTNDTGFTLLGEWMRASKCNIPSELILKEIDLVEHFTDKSYITIFDIILLGYYKCLTGDKITTELDALYKQFNIKEFIPNPEYLSDIREMVKGVRASVPVVTVTTNAPATETRTVAETTSESFNGPVKQYILEMEPNPRIRASSALRCEREYSPPSTPLASTPLASTPLLADAVPQTQHIYNDILTFREFSDKLDTHFWDRDAIQSTALDIIAIYLKGQKILYTEAKTFCEQNLYLLMLPAILISAACTVLSVSLNSYPWGTILVSSLTATNSFILSIVSYLKLDAKAEAHKTTSYQFDKLQTLCEFHSGKVLFFNDTSAKEVVEEIDKRVAEIKDNNQFIIPESVRYRFPMLYNTNVFTEVKKIENEENVIKNTLNIIFNQLDSINKGASGYSRDDITILNKRKVDLLNNYLQSRNRYLKLDKDYNDEINTQIFGKGRRGYCCNPFAILKS